ncbi:MAG: helix-turn-helix transcriptional regulator [Bacilli bacterium]|nr:helix-turn-helix transcriptional regulator [Bacilli bacterium]
MNQEKIGKFIAKLRNEKNMTQIELGEILGVSYKAVSKWERGLSLPDASLYNEICKIFGITKDELFAGKRIKLKVKKYLIIIAVLIVTFSFITYITTPKFYKIKVINEEMFYSRYTGGILVDGVSKDAFQLTISLNNPDKVRLIGLFILDNNGDLKLLESYGKGEAVKSEAGYANTTEAFTRVEKSFQKGNIISKMLNNKDNTYLCVSNKPIDKLTYEDCFKIIFEKIK